MNVETTTARLRPSWWRLLFVIAAGLGATYLVAMHLSVSRERALESEGSIIEALTLKDGRDQCNDASARIGQPVEFTGESDDVGHRTANGSRSIETSGATLRTCHKATEICSQEVRLRRVKTACDVLSRHNARTRLGTAEISVFLNVEQRVFHCIVPRACSKALEGYFFRLNEGLVSDTEYNIVNHSYHMSYERLSHLLEEGVTLKGFYRIPAITSQDTKRLFLSYTKVINVRHPMQRIYTAYFNRIHKHGTAFPAFIQQVLDGRYNRHWATYHEICLPCVFDYDVIMKTETMSLDEQIVTERFGWNKGVGHAHLNKKLNYTVDPHSNCKYDKLLNEFKLSHPTLFTGLLEYLQPDMELFGYSWDGSQSFCSDPDDGCC